MRKPLLLALSVLVCSARADIIPGLEAYGDLTLVDEVNCATDTTHEFHEHATDASSVQTILGSACRVLPHPSGNAGFFSYRIGKGKGLVAHDMYLLVVEYPEDVPRTASLLNRAMNSRNGWHTGNTVGETLTAHIIDQTHPESISVPLSGTYKRLEQVMFLNEKVYPYDSTSSFIDSVANGFDVIIHVFAAADALDSAGAAVRAIKLYHINDESAIRATINYPTGDAPKRHVTWRDEMGKHYGLYNDNADKFDDLRMKMRLMKALGIDTWSRDLFEFGANQYIDVGYNACGNWYWGTDPDYWTTEVGIYADAGIYLLPYYEYEGGLKGSGLGISSACGGTPLFEGPGGTHVNQLVKASNGASKAAVDISDAGVYTEFRAILDATILRYKDQANFVGAWIRNRGSIGVSFNDATINRFCQDKGYASGSVTRTTLKDGKDYRGLCKICQPSQWPAQYAEYRNWWYGKRAEWLQAMQSHLAANGLPDAKVFYSGVINEPGAAGRDFGVGSWQGLYEDTYSPVAYDDSSWLSCGYSGKTETIQTMSQKFYPNFLNADNITWPDNNGKPTEYNHAAPHDDPENYATRSNVALCYPYNCVYTTIPDAAAQYRNATDDLFFARHYCLYEGCGNGVGYFTTEMDRVGRAIMLPELHAMAYQDPTVIGFLQGGHLARNSTKEFREFNENFLSLPAIQGTVLLGGTWGNAVTVRKYTTDTASYYAAINVSGSAVNAIFPVPESSLFETVSGAQHALSDGQASVSLEPYQMICFTTENVGGGTAASISVSDVTATTATVSATISELGSATASISVLYSTNADLSGATALPSVTVAGIGTTTFSLSPLSPSTTYYVQVAVDDGTGAPLVRSASFTTPRYPIALGDPVGTCSGTGTNATAKVAVAIADVAATLALSVDGAPVRTWTGVSAGTEYAASFPIAVGETKDYAFSLSADGCTNVVKTGQITGRQVIDWFNVPLADDAYTSWALASGADPYEPTARWTLSGAQNASVVGTDGSGAHAIALATGSDGTVSYAPAFPSESGRTLEISGTATLLAHPAAPPVPEDAPIAGLAVGTANGAPVLYGWGAAGWTTLSGGAVTTNAPVAWKATLDFAAGTIAYSLGGVAFSPNPALPAGAGSATRVAFRGSGAIGAFRGVYADSASGSVTLYQAALRVDGSGVSFGTTGDNPDFVIGLKDTIKDRWYVAFAADSLDTREADWVCVACGQSPANGAEIDLPCSTVDATTGEPIPAQFFKIFGASQKISIGTAFGDL